MDAWTITGITALLAAVFFLGKTLPVSWAHPAKLFAGIWAFFVCIPLLFPYGSYRWQGAGSLWILSGIVCTEIGCFAGSSLFRRIGRTAGRRPADAAPALPRAAWWYLGATVFLAFAGVILQIRLQGVHLSNLFDVSELLSINTQMAYDRYNGGTVTNPLVQILLLFTYLAALCGGYGYSYARTRRARVFCFLTFLPILILMLLSNAKAGFVAACILWAAGFLVSHYAIYGRAPRLNARRLLLFAVLLAAVMALLYLVMLLRVGSFSKLMRERIANKFWVYAFGQMVSFDAWFAEKRNFWDLGLGSNTYMMVFRMFGLVTRRQGVYTVLVPGYGNVFTAFRGVIADFGAPGGLVYLFCRGMAVSCCYKAVLADGTKSAPLAQCLLVCFYFWGIYGFIISPWIYSSFVLTMLGYLLFLYLAQGRIKWKKGTCSQ
jgi:oligosaccharide repeat unit polymerase